MVAANDAGDAVAFRPAGEDPTDDQLLDAYCTKRDDSAFAELVRRHGSLVWRVCRRALGPTPDAEDAFQATFVVLIRKAGSIRWKRSIAGWLYQVAHRVSLRLRTQIARRAAAVSRGSKFVPLPAEASDHDERRRAIEEEVAQLPESLRLPVVLCYLQGLTNIEAANRIGCPEGTVASRLARARERLRRRLRARGIAVVGSAALVEALADGTSAALAPTLEKATLVVAGKLAASSAAPAVLSLSAVRLGHGVARSMSWHRLLQGSAAVMLGTAVVGSILVFHLGLWSTKREPDGVSGAPAQEMMRADPALNVAVQNWMALTAALRGDWVLEEWQFAGEMMQVTPAEQHIEFADGRCILINITGNRPGPVLAELVFDPRDTGQGFELLVNPDDNPYRVQCLYELVDDTLRLSIGFPNSARPVSLNSARGDRHHSYFFRRAAAAMQPPPPD